MKEGTCWLLRVGVPVKLDKAVRDGNVAGTAPFCIQIAGSALARSSEVVFSRHSCYSAIE